MAHSHTKEKRERERGGGGEGEGGMKQLEVKKENRKSKTYKICCVVKHAQIGHTSPALTTLYQRNSMPNI